jgi:hypothetical protein
MSTTTTADPRTNVATRVLSEGYGPGAWHGADLKAALADVTPDLALWRPGPGRHNIAEIALHHAYCSRAVRAQISGKAPESFIVAGEDWFEVSENTSLSWSTVHATLEAEQQKLGEVVAEVDAGKAVSPLAEAARFDLVLGITCHAVYHAGQIQLIKKLRGA